MFRMSCLWMSFACLFVQEPKPEQKLATTQPMTPETIAGRYATFPDFFGSYYELKSDGRFTYDFLTDAGAGRHDEGTFTIADGMIDFRVSKTNVDEKNPEEFGPHPRMHPVRWGKRIYLIAEKEMVDYCSDVNLGTEPRETIYGDFYAKMAAKEPGDEVDNKLVSIEKPYGLPEVPERWKSYLLKKPVEGKVVAKLPDHRAMIDIGSADGLKVGMLLLVERKKVNGSDSPYRLARLVSVEDHSSIIDVSKWDHLGDGIQKDSKVLSRRERK